MGDYAAFSATFICGLTVAVILQSVQASPGCCTSTSQGCYRNNTQCICKSGSAPHSCQLATGDGEICLECCSPNYLLCSTQLNGKYEQECIYFPPDICRNKFFTFAQVALVCALATAFSALGAICWKICRGRNAASVSSLLRERESSLTSVQRFIIQRLQDRPPRYEDSNQIHLEKPPPYQEAIGDTIPRSLSLPFILNIPPSSPNQVPTANLNSNGSNLHSHSAEGANSTNIVQQVITNENIVRQQATQTEALSVQNLQVNSNNSSTAENINTIEQRINFPESLENAEIRLTEEHISLSTEIKCGVDNPGFLVEEEIKTETQAP